MIKAIYKGKKNVQLINDEIPKAGDNDIVIKLFIQAYAARM